MGDVPVASDINLQGLAMGLEQLRPLLEVDESGWDQELVEIQDYLQGFNPRLPQRLQALADELRDQLQAQQPPLSSAINS